MTGYIRETDHLAKGRRVSAEILRAVTHRTGSASFGGDLVAKYLEPLAMRTALRERIHFNQRVIAVTRLATDKVRTKERESRPFVIRTVAPDGAQHEHLARAVIDATGTWTKPNPMGADGLPPLGEEQVRDCIDTGIPDVRGARRDEFAGSTVLVVGSGHSAFNTVLDLLSLKHEELRPGTDFSPGDRLRTGALGRRGTGRRSRNRRSRGTRSSRNRRVQPAQIGR